MSKKILGLVFLWLGLLASPQLWALGCTYTTTHFYNCEDSNTNASLATTYAWQEIGTTGTQVTTGDDVVSANIPISFSFFFGGAVYTTVNISSNGPLEFGTTNNASYSSTAITSPALPTTLIPYWRDLNPTTGQIKYQTLGTAPNRIFVVQYTSVVDFGTASTNTFQTQLYENGGAIVYRYKAMNGNGNTGFTGYYYSATDYGQYSGQAANLTNGLTLVWTHPAKLLTQLHFEETAWTSTAGQVLDSSGNSRAATAIGSPLPTPLTASPARSGSTGTCGYANLPGGASNGGAFTLPSLPVYTTTNAKTSVSFWMYWDGTNSVMPIGWYQYDLWLNGGAFGFNTAASDIYGITSTGLANGWHHVVAIFANGNYLQSQLYIDGTLKTLSQQAGSQNTSLAVVQTTLQSGGWTSATNFRFSGRIDELKVYEGALTLSEITTLYNETHACPNTVPTPLTEYRMDQANWNGTASEIIDSGGLYNGTAKGGTSTAGAKLCRGGLFDGTSNYAEVPDNANLQLTGSWTMAAWIKTTSTSVNTIISKDDLVSPWKGYEIAVGMGGSGVLSAYLGSGAWYYSTGSLVNDGLWHHVAVQVNGTSLQFYVDGAASGSVISTTGSTTKATTPLRIGLNSDSASSWSRFFNGQIDELKLWNTALTATQITTVYTNELASKGWDGSARSCPVVSWPNHIRLISNTTPLTCAPNTVTIKACDDNLCNSLFTGSTTITLSSLLGGVATGTWSPSTQTFISTTTANLSVTTAGTVTIGTSAVSPAASNATRCFVGSTETCNLTYADSGFLFDVPDHFAETSQSVNITAVQKATGSSGCSSAFANQTKSLNIKCSYNNPATGTLPVRVNSIALNSSYNTALACDSAGITANVAFNASGIASGTVMYADVGKMQITAKYTGSNATGDAGLVMTGTDTFIAAPKSFSFSNITAAPIKAGNNFAATVNALNSINAITPNFGKETTPESASLNMQVVQPTGSGAATGTFTSSLGSFSNGSASNTLNWSEVGLINLTATLSSGNYLSSGFTASGTSANIGAFVPDHFDTTVQQACVGDGFTYSGQPFSATVTARNASGGTTLNYDGTANTSPNFAKAVALSEGGTSLGAISSGTIALTNFTAGAATTITPVFTFTNAETVTSSIAIRATDANASSSGFTEGVVSAVSGRLNLQNASGSELLDLPVPLQVEYWVGNSYEKHTTDNCTALTIPTLASGLSFTGSTLNSGDSSASINGVSSGSTILTGGIGGLTLTKPTSGKIGFVDITINAPSWLEFDWQGAGKTDPKARATFGIYATDPNTIYFREVY
jgi:MSHA biogenesis protein MshQ